MRRAARTDSNQSAIVAALRGIPGVSVRSTAQLGDGFPDLVVGYRGTNYMFEVKDPAQPPSKRRLTSDEVDFHAEWRGAVRVVLTLDECLEAMGIA